MTTQGALKIIVEGSADAQIIRAILGKDLAKRVRFFAGQGRESLATVGRNVLFHEGGPVLLVMDSETLDPRLTAELQAMNRVAMNGAITSGGQFPVPPASDVPPFGVFAFVPEIEAVFFEAPQALERALGRKLAQEKVREGLLIPKRTLSELINNANGHRDYQSILKEMDPQAERAIASGQQAKALMETVESMLAAPADV